MVNRFRLLEILGRLLVQEETDLAKNGLEFDHF